MGLILRSPDIVETVRENAIAAQRVETMMTARARAPLDKWHNIGDPGEPAFLHGWRNYGGGYNPAGYFKDTSGFVHLRGLIQPPTAYVFNFDLIVFTLPAGYRPPFIEYQVALEQYPSGTTTALTAVGLIIDSLSGNVDLRNLQGTPSYVSLDDHLFRNQ